MWLYYGNDGVESASFVFGIWPVTCFIHCFSAYYILYCHPAYPCHSSSNHCQYPSQWFPPATHSQRLVLEGGVIKVAGDSVCTCLGISRGPSRLSAENRWRYGWGDQCQRARSLSSWFPLPHGPEVNQHSSMLTLSWDVVSYLQSWPLVLGSETLQF